MAQVMEREGKEVLRRLEKAGFEAYFVGGCVRDKLLGRKLKDIDIATAALPEQVMRLFPRTAPTGLQHGTVTVIMDEYTFEVTTFRKESEYEQFRRPKEVEFISDLTEDLRRRDFTINAMALDASGACIDPFGGAADLAARIVRCVGEPIERFNEDALRMLRGIRFASEYGFELEERTWKALLHHAPHLKHVAMERVTSELEKMIEGQAPDRAIALLADSGLLRHLKQPIDWTGLDQFAAHMEASTELKLKELEGADLRWAGFLLQLGMNSSEAKTTLKLLKFAGKKSASIVRLLETDAAMKRSACTFESVADGCVAYGAETVRAWLRLAAWQAKSAEDGVLAKFAANGPAWVDEVPASRITELAVTGSDLTSELGVRAGPIIGKCLGHLLIQVSRRKLENERETLLREATILVKQE